MDFIFWGDFIQRLGLSVNFMQIALNHFIMFHMSSDRNSLTQTSIGSFEFTSLCRLGVDF